MKKKIYQIALVILLSFAAYTTISVSERKDALAVCVPCVEWGTIITKITALGSNVASSFLQGTKDMFASQVETKEEELVADEEMLKKLSTEELGSRAAAAGLAADQAEALAEIKRSHDMMERAEDNARDFPAVDKTVCEITTAKMAKNETRRHTKVTKAILKEKNRRKRTNVAGSPGAKGQIVRSTAMKAVLKESCATDENRGNASDFCKLSGTDEDASAHISIAEVLAGDGVLTEDKQEAIELYDELTQGAQTPLLSKEAFSNPAGTDTYLAYTVEDARQRMIDHVNEQLRAERTPPQSCTDTKPFVTQISKDVYGVNDYWGLEGACPPEAIIDAATAVMGTSAENLANVATSIEGNGNKISIERSINRLSQTFDELRKLQINYTIDAMERVNGSNF